MTPKRALIVGLILIAVFGFVLVLIGYFFQSRSSDITAVNKGGYFPEMPNDLTFIDENKYVLNLISQWQTCENDNKRITFAYPKDWVILDKSQENATLSDCSSDSVVFSPASSLLDPSVEIKYLGNSQTMEEYYKSHSNQFKNDPIKNGGYVAFDDNQGAQAYEVSNGNTKTTYVFRAKDIFLVTSVNVPDLYIYTFIRGIRFPQFTTSTKKEDWKNICRNQIYGYEVRYPEGIKAFTGDLISGIQVLDDCMKKSNTINLTPLDQKFMGIYPSGIGITVVPGEPKRTFNEKDILKRTTIGGKEVVWISKYHGEFYNGSTRFEIDLANDLSKETTSEILSTFKFLK